MNIDGSTTTYATRMYKYFTIWNDISFLSHYSNENEIFLPYINENVWGRNAELWLKYHYEGPKYHSFTFVYTYWTGVLWFILIIYLSSLASWGKINHLAKTRLNAETCSYFIFRKRHKISWNIICKKRINNPLIALSRHFCTEIMLH